MSNDPRSVVSRRQCVALASTAIGSAMFACAAEDAQPRPADNLAGARVYNLRDFGAKGDGTTIDTAALQAAIDACHGDRGGTVVVPAGDFLIGTVQLKSNVTLHLAAQGRLLGSGRRADYSAGKGVPPSNGNVVLLYAADAENITIEGPGTIDGQGANFYTGQGDGTGPGGGGRGNVDRPHLLVFYQCTNLVLREAFFTRSAYHCCRILQCRHVRIDGVRIHNRVNKNNDGFHFVSSQHVHVANCTIACQDDACALFGSNKFVTVDNCSFSTRWSVFRFGGGEAENVAVSNCIIYETWGCPIKMRCGPRSRLENMIFSNLVMKDVTGPIYIGLDSRSRPRGSATSTAVTQPSDRGIVRNIAFRSVRATVAAQPRQHEDMPFAPKPYPGEIRSCIVLNGVGDDVLENISLSDVHVTVAGGGTAEEAAVRDVPQIAGEYFQTGTPPAYGLYARNIRGLTLDGVRLTTAEPDLRPAVILDRVHDAAVTGLSVQGNPAAESALRFINVTDVLLSAPRLLTPAATFLQLEGDANDAIVIDGGDVSKASKPLAFARGATDRAIRLRA
jgi:polygalacturonase